MAQSPHKQRKAAVWSGFGGLGAAIRQSAGIKRCCTRRGPPGRRASFEDEGFTFDAGPTVITAPHTHRIV